MKNDERRRESWRGMVWWRGRGEGGVGSKGGDEGRE